MGRETSDMVRKAQQESRRARCAELRCRLQWKGLRLIGFITTLGSERKIGGRDRTGLSGVPCEKSACFFTLSICLFFRRIGGLPRIHVLG